MLNITENIMKKKNREKISSTLPSIVEDLIQCKNPRCITREESYIVHKFVIVDATKGIYKCEYCDQICF